MANDPDIKQRTPQERAQCQVWGARPGSQHMIRSIENVMGGGGARELQTLPGFPLRRQAGQSSFLSAECRDT